jgi:hypothetical protein
MKGITKRKVNSPLLVLFDYKTSKDSKFTNPLVVDYVCEIKEK